MSDLYGVTSVSMSTLLLSCRHRWSSDHTLTSIVQVLHQVEHGFRMQQPQGCPPALYDIMLECWHKVTIHCPPVDCIPRTCTHADINCFHFRIQWRDRPSRPCSGSWRTSSRCLTLSTRKPPSTDTSPCLLARHRLTPHTDRGPGTPPCKYQN